MIQSGIYWFEYVDLISAPLSKVRVRKNTALLRSSSDFIWLEIEARGIIDFEALEKEILERGYSHYEMMARDFNGRGNGHIREIPL